MMVGKDIKTATNLPKEMQSHHDPVLYEVEETHLSVLVTAMR